jgi:hypothetical protein
MMNMIELQDKLKNFSQEQLVGMMQQPSGEAPQFMVLGEITRRQKMQQEATKAPTQSVAQEAVSAAGVPQGGIADMARTLAPQTNVAQNTGAMSAPPQDMPSAPQGIAKMASGGVIKMQAAGRVGFIPMEQLGKMLTADPEDRPKRKLIATVPVGRRGDLVNVYDDYTFINVDENGNEGWLVTSPTESNAVFEALGIPAEERLVKQYDRGENHTGYTPLEGYVPPEQRAAPAAESAPTGLGAYAAPTMDAPVSDSAPSTPVFDATVEAPSLNQAPAADIIPVYNDFLYGDRPRPTYDSAAPQMPVPPKTDSMPQGPRPSGTQVNIAGNIYAVLGDGSVVDQMGRTPPPPVAELARQKAGTPAAQFTTQQQYQDAQNLANRIGANSGENAVLPSENLLMGGGREGTPYLNTPAADTAIYAGGYDPRTNVPSAPSGLAALSQETMPTVGGPAAPPPPPEFIPWDKTGKNQENFGRFGQYEAGMDYLLRKARDAVISDGPSMSVDYGTGEKNFSPYSGAYIPPEYLGKETIESVVKLPGQAIDFIAPAFENEFSELTPQELDTMTEAQARALQAERLASKKPETKDTPLEKSDLAAELTDAMKPKPRPKDLFAPTTDNAREGGGSGTGTGSGSGGSSNYETKLLEMLSRQEANAKSDKWMALAQAGMSLMQGGTGSFGGDLGRAGQTGLAALQGSRASNDKSQLDILGAIENSKLKREAIAASAAKGSAYDVNDYVKLLADLATQKQTIMADPSTTNAEKELAVKDITIEEARIRELMFPGRANSTPKPQTFDATKPPGIIRQGIDAVRGFVTG